MTGVQTCALPIFNKCGTTVVMVTHEHTLVNEFNHRVVTIDEGQVVSDDRLDGGYYIE